LEKRESLIDKNPGLKSRVRPYIGGEEILTHPLQQFHRYVILLSDLETEADLEPWRELAEIVREKVKPERDKLGDNPNNTPLKRRWWAFQAHRPQLYHKLGSMKRVLVTSQVNPQFAFAMMPADWIFSHKAIVFCFDSYSGFANIQSRIHEVWARYFSSTSLELLSYTPSDCFETFPFAPDWESNEVLATVGEAYYEFRAALMIRNNEGLTKTYNRLHKPDERSAEIVELRRLHDAMDRAVLEAYGWNDIAPTCEFFPEFDDEDEDDSSRPGRANQAKYRYRWPVDTHDEVLARLLALNRERASQQAEPQQAVKDSPSKAKVSKKPKTPTEPLLF
jgi:hypothetical protein